MMHKRMLVVLFVVMALVMVGCLSGGVDQEAMDSTSTAIAAGIYATQTASGRIVITPFEDLQPTSTPTRTPRPTPTPQPTPTKTPTPTPEPQAEVLADSLALRNGPKKTFAKIGTLRAGDLVRVLGKSVDCAWLLVETGEGEQGWILGGETQLSVNFECDEMIGGVYRPKNGQIVQDDRPSKGRGKFKVENGTDLDGVVILANLDDEPLVAMYVRDGAKATLSGVRDGTYRVFFSTGEDWDAAELQFRSFARFQRFDDTLKFRTTASTYTIWTVTLHAVAGGTASTSPAGSDFPDLK